MKRSTAITLLGAGVAAWAGINYFSDDTVSAAAYENVGQCTADGKSREACERAFAQASDEHQKSAPHYARREDCEAEFGSGACTTLPGSPGSAAGSFFVPAMAGFLLANAFYSTYPAQPLYRPCSDPNDPRCRGSSFNGGTAGSGGRWFFTSTGERVATGAGNTEVGRSAFNGHGSAATLSRGGFGARAASMGGGRS
ncbi:MAG TPA: DUF1190 domain-containing protein [Stellaceae bacterium]|nr:DUF1190 domain-containing protein [Stellaceae bacterium]